MIEKYLMGRLRLFQLLKARAHSHSQVLMPSNVVNTDSSAYKSEPERALKCLVYDILPYFCHFDIYVLYR